MSVLGAEGFTTQEDHELLLRIEKNLKRRFAIGTQISVQTVVQSFVQQVVSKVFFFKKRLA